MAESAHTYTGQMKLPSAESLLNASGGATQRGLLLTHNPEDAGIVRRTVLQVPTAIKILQPVIQQQEDVIEMFSKYEADEFNKTMDVMGYTLSANLKERGWIFQTDTIYKEQHRDEHTKTFYSRVIRSLVPTAACELNIYSLTLSPEALSTLKNIEVSLGTTNETLIQDECTNFLQSYGSHINVGLIHFGGVYRCIATYSNEETVDFKHIQSMVENVQSAYVKAANSNVGWDVEGSVDGESVQNKCNLSSLYSASQLSKVKVHITKLGGSPNAASLSVWLKGLYEENTTWAVIDRGYDSNQSFRGIWEIIATCTEDFRDAKMLAITIGNQWKNMSSVSSIDWQHIKVTSGIEQIDSLVKEIASWDTDESSISSASKNVDRLLTKLQNACDSTGDNKAWTECLNNDKVISDYLLYIIQNEHLLSKSEVSHIRYMMRKLISMSIHTKYMSSNGDIIRWIKIGMDADTSFDTMSKIVIEDVPGFMQAIKQKMLSPQVIEPTELSSTEISRKDLVIMVNTLIDDLQRRGDRYQCLFLCTELLQLGYNRESRLFEMVIDTKTLDNFMVHLRKEWKLYEQYQKVGLLEQQAYLVHRILESLDFRRQPEQMECQFISLLQQIHNNLVPEINQCVNKFALASPFNWEVFNFNIANMMKGDKLCLKEVISINGLEVLSDISEKVEDIVQAQIEGHPDSNTPSFVNLLELLGLTQYYPGKINSQRVMAISSDLSDVNKFQRIKTNLPWVLLQKMIMNDYRCRDSEVAKVNTSMRDSQKEDTASDDIHSFLDECSDVDSSEHILHPQDVFLVIFCCCDLMLKQTVVQKMFLCRLAVPFVYPHCAPTDLVMSLWALRSIVVEWRDANQCALEKSIVQQAFPIVSAIRLGKPSVSKSRLLNDVLCDQTHHTFFHKDCPEGSAERNLSSGLIEASWFFPAGKSSDIFKEVVTFLNLRGDGLDYSTQVEILSKISTTMAICVDIEYIGDTRLVRQLQILLQSSAQMILLLSSNPSCNPNKTKITDTLKLLHENIDKNKMPRIISGFKGKKQKNLTELREDMRATISKTLNTGNSISLAEIANNLPSNILTDEKNQFCKRGRMFAEKIVAKVTNKKDMLPLQGHLWLEWSQLLKKQHRCGGKKQHAKTKTVHQMEQIKQKMISLRKEQLLICQNITGITQLFMSALRNTIDKNGTAVFLLQWLKLFLDDKSREYLPPLHRKYQEIWQSLKGNTGEDKTRDVHNTKDLTQELAIAEQQLDDACLGLEHFMREIGQIYEATMESCSSLSSKTKQAVEGLPLVAAKLLLQGHPMEIMDGDTSNIPLTWVKAVLSSMRVIKGNKRMFVLSVLGIQSSGKSTLLNTMFGLQFAVSAGRCTRGVYIQLVEVDKETSSLPFDYVLVVDTEGLRAPELGQLKHDHDNELATFVIGLGDVTIMNVKGENVAEVKDVLQIAVHAFLRMKIVNRNINWHRSCIFIHQNVPAVNAREKMVHGRQKLQDNLDEMTAEAANLENISDIHAFNQVIDFDAQTNVWYFSDLWHGDPPMAPTNPGYSEKVMEVKNRLLYDIAKTQRSFLTISDLMLRIEDLWKGILSDDFVFSFRNSLAAKAYNNLEEKFFELAWELEQFTMEWLATTAKTELNKCQTANELDGRYNELLPKIDKEITSRVEELKSDLQEYMDKSNLKDILIEWESEKMSSLNSISRQCSNHAKHELIRMKESQELDLLQTHTRKGHEGEILSKAKKLADSLKGKKACNEMLHSKFNEMWVQIVSDMTSKEVDEGIFIDAMVESILIDRLRKDSGIIRAELNKPHEPYNLKSLEESLCCEDIANHDISVKTSFRHGVRRLLGISDPKTEYKMRAIKVIDVIMRKIDSYLNDLTRQTTPFHASHATYVIKTLVDGIEQHNKQKDYPFTFLPSLKVKLALHVCRHSVTRFKEMQDDYARNHGTVAKLNAYRNTVWNLFKNMVQKRTDEVIAADFFWDRLKELIKTTVKDAMPLKVVDIIMRDFGNIKYHLMTRMMDTMATNGIFCNFKEYIQDSKLYALKWITNYTNFKFFNRRSDGASCEYTEQAKAHIQKIINCVRRSIEEATKHVISVPNATIATWIHTCNMGLEKELVIPTEYFQQMTTQCVSDFENFEDLLLIRLEAGDSELIALFNGDDEHNVKWGGFSPYKHVADKLWGCSAQCPFCGEPCQFRDPDHESNNISHQCIQHRPGGVGGERWDEDYRKGTLVVETCNYKVQWQTIRFNCRDCHFECRNSERCDTTGDNRQYHDYIEYKTYLPKWDIAPKASMESSEYWQWFMATYQSQLTDMYSAQLPDIPESWRDITVQRAKDSLRRYDN